MRLATITPARCRHPAGHSWMPWEQEPDDYDWVICAHCRILHQMQPGEVLSSLGDVLTHDPPMLHEV